MFFIHDLSKFYYQPTHFLYIVLIAVIIYLFQPKKIKAKHMKTEIKKKTKEQI